MRQRRARAFSVFPSGNTLKLTRLSMLFQVGEALHSSRCFVVPSVLAGGAVSLPGSKPRSSSASSGVAVPSLAAPDRRLLRAIPTSCAELVDSAQSRSDFVGVTFTNGAILSRIEHGREYLSGIEVMFCCAF